MAIRSRELDALVAHINRFFAPCKDYIDRIRPSIATAPRDITTFDGGADKSIGDVLIDFGATLLLSDGSVVAYNPHSDKCIVEVRPKDRTMWERLGEILKEGLNANLTKDQRDAWVAMCTLYAIHREGVE